MICVLDASAALEVYLNRPQCMPLRAILHSAKLIVAPDLYSAEISNVFWKLQKFNQLGSDSCELGIKACLALVEDLIPVEEYAKEIYAAAVAYNMSAYDMCYAVTTRRYNANLLTVDKKLKSTCELMRLKVY
jgi:predicted nucleic acid-binding protein